MAINILVTADSHARPHGGIWHTGAVGMWELNTGKTSKWVCGHLGCGNVGLYVG